MNEFLNQQDERLVNSRKMLNEARRELARQVLGDVSSGSGIDYDSQTTIEMVHMPLKKLRLKDMLKFMVVALNRWDIIFVVMAFLMVSLLGIARALVGKPSILIFDEATSALDNITQRKVTENLNALNCTRIFIAHRLSTIRHCQRIIVLDKGHVAEEGTYEELMARQGVFYQLASRQIA